MTTTLNQGSSERAPSLQEFVRRAVDAYMRNHFKCIPAVVTSYDASTRKASLKVLIKNPYLDEEDARQIESIPIITGIPVVFPGTGTYELTFPISDGNLIVNGQPLAATQGVLWFTDRSMDKWLSGTGREVDPTPVDHFHSKTDGIFEPGLYSFSGAPQASPTDALHLGPTAGSDFVALAMKVLTQLTDIVNAFNSHTHPYINVTTGATTSAPTVPMSAPSSVAAQSVKAQ